MACRMISGATIAVLLLATACSDDAAGTGGGGGSAGGSGGTSSAGGGGMGGEGGSGGVVESAGDRLHRYLDGRFDSADQANADPEYFAVQLQTCPVEAPELGDQVLYVEQALMSSLAQPYRQRLYVVESGADATTQAVSRVFELTAPATFVGACDEATPRTVTAAETIERAGCDVLVALEGESFVGGTMGMGCASDLNGASYATSEVTITPDRIDSWDRGYDGAGVQVWGAVAGPYEFVRRTPRGGR
ncbi:MAG: chromophore lyase CpcT/CpeT [Myxococcales bacterium]|nr:chromophore lyase CpcT/CpeT [Myxococcales bacterium]